MVRVLACPDCRGPLAYSGGASRGRLADGTFGCPRGHEYQVKGGIPMLKRPRQGRGEFVWKVSFPDLKRYDEVRRRYASYLSDGQRSADELMIEEMVARTPRSGVLLDLASGMGTLLLALSEARGRAQILGTDVDETPLRGAMLKLKEEGAYRPVSLCVTDARRLAVGSKRVSCAVSHFGFNNIPHAETALSEAARVLAAKGTLMFSALELREGSRSFRLAERLGYGEVAGEGGLVTTLEGAGFKVDGVERFHSARWLRNPMDRLPLEGDWFAHSLVRAHVR